MPVVGYWANCQAPDLFNKCITDTGNAVLQYNLQLDVQNNCFSTLYLQVF
jgi:hypothetical protein